MRILWAFIRRDWLIASSYRASMFFTVAGGLVTLTTFHFLARLVGQAPALKSYGADYFSFALLGVAIASCLRNLQASFPQRVRESQVDGSLEVMFLAPLSTFRVLASLAAYPILSALLKALALVLVGSWLFGARLSLNLAGFAATLALSMVPFVALGLLSAAVVLVTKRADPFTFALDTANYLLCGVIYPIEVLPPTLQSVAKFLPATYALRALRSAGLGHATIGQLLPSWGILALFGAILWPAAGWALAWARRHVEQTGTLPQG